MSFLSAEDIIAELDKDEPAEGSEEADLSFQGVENDLYMAFADKEQSNIDAREDGKDKSEQPNTNASKDNLGETEQAQTASEGEPNQEGPSSTHEGPSVCISSKESSQEVPSEEDSSEGTQMKKATHKRKETRCMAEKQTKTNSGKKYVSSSKKVVSGKLLRLYRALCVTHHHASMHQTHLMSLVL